MNSNSKSNNSICEKSMKLMTNIVKVSYISIATFGFRTGAPQQPLARATPNPSPSLCRYPRNLRSHEPTVSYLINPGDTKKSSMNMIRDDESVDREALDFIERVRAKHMKDASKITNQSELVLPPPPRVKWQSSAAY
ncbi:hypothetical protein Hanom_Chr08g00735751 [Helianthus anomalus]